LISASKKEVEINMIAVTQLLTVSLQSSTIVWTDLSLAAREVGQ